MRNEEIILKQVVSWAQSKKNIRSVVITSSRANPKASVDILSDYDIELVVTRLHDFDKNEKWVFHFGDVIADINERNSKSLTRLVLYSDGVRIDFQIYTVSEFNRRTENASIPAHWDIGYKVLLDKDQLMTALAQPSYTKFNIKQPSEKEFALLLKDFWWDTTYVSKSLWRDEIFYAKYIFDSLLRSKYLLKILEWHIGLHHNWSVNTNKNGRWLKRYLDKETWAQVEKTFVDGDVEKNREALYAIIHLFSTLVKEVAKQLNYEYPFNLEKNVIEYLKKIDDTEKMPVDF